MANGYWQYQLVQGDSILTCWLESDGKLRRGQRVTLKGVQGQWVITEVYSTYVSEPPLTKWQVGGLA